MNPTRSSNRSVTWENGAEDARSPDALRLPGSPNRAKRLECVRFIRRLAHSKTWRELPRFMDSPLSAFFRMHWDLEPRTSRTVPPTRCCRRMVGRAFLRFLCRQDAGSTLRSWKANSLSDEIRQAAAKAGASEVEHRVSEIRKWISFSRRPNSPSRCSSRARSNYRPALLFPEPTHPKLY